MALASLIERLERTDAATLDAAGVAAGLRDVQRLRGFLADTEHAIARRADQLAANGSGAPASELLGRSANCSPREAARTARRAETLGLLPAVSNQLAKGRIGTEHADAVTSAARRLDDGQRQSLLALDDDLARTAAATTPGQFKRFLDRVVDQLGSDIGLERTARQRMATQLSTGIDDETGMYWLRGEFDPESGARLFRAIDAESRALAGRPEHERSDRRQLAALALIELATSANRSRRPGRTELLALVDLDTITGGLHDRSVCELDDGTTLPVETVRRLACDAHIIPVVLNGEGVPLDLGRSRRFANGDQRRALRAIYRTCGIGTCDVAFERCEIHHIAEWTADAGETDLDALIPGCSRHHHLVHEGGWRLELDPDTRELTITLPDGTLHSRTRPARARPPTPRRSNPVAAPTAGRVA